MKKILIFGGSGSLGNKLIEKYAPIYKIVNYSRDECKHWEMELRLQNNNITHIIGDIRDKNKVEIALMRENPDIVIIASALKHVDKCEYNSNESIETNLLGVKNILDTIEMQYKNFSNLSKVLFVSTDKACSPVNIYGMCKSLAEKLVIEKSHYMSNISFYVVRYGNVLNSRGSLIPILTSIGKSDKDYILTDKNMTRFIMTLDECYDLIDYTLNNAESGDTVIPYLRAIYVRDLISIFCDIYGKTYKETQMKVGEKINESLINETQSVRTIKKIDNMGKIYYHTKSNYKYGNMNAEMFDYNSKVGTIMKDELLDFLKKNNMLDYCC